MEDDLLIKQFKKELMQLYKINLHSHTRYSDGAHTVEQMAQMSKNLGFCCHVITDHYYGSKDLSPYSLNPGTFMDEIEEARRVSEKLNFPIIVGAECGFNRMEEINVFGHEAILYLMNHGVGIDQYRYAREHFNCAMILNHPSVGRSLKAGVHEIIDGFERYNSGQDYFKGEDKYNSEDHREIPYELKMITQYSNSDAHQMSSLDRGYNLIDEKIESTNQLVSFLKKSKTPILSACGDIKTDNDVGELLF